MAWGCTAATSPQLGRWDAGTGGAGAACAPSMATTTSRRWTPADLPPIGWKPPPEGGGQYRVWGLWADCVGLAWIHIFSTRAVNAKE